jgi:hypothetical protein
MIPVRFAFSFDRERFDGNLDTRQDALKTALQKVPTLDSSPEAVFVGKRVPMDPGSSGLAEMILGAMRRRLREQAGEAANGYLMRVNEHQPTQSKIVAISEHPVPQPSMQTSSRNGNEVSELGETQYPISLS